MDSFHKIAPAVHRHAMRFVPAADGKQLFCCDLCDACVEIVPTVDGHKVTASARVRRLGIRGFAAHELQALCRFWLGRFVALMELQGSGRPARRHKRVVTRQRVVGIWADPSGVDRS